MAVQNRSHVLKLLDAHQEQIRAFGVKRCGLFGSFVRQDFTAQSDVDKLVQELDGQQDEDGKGGFGNRACDS